MSDLNIEVSIPTTPQGVVLGEGVDFRERRIFLTGEIEEDTGGWFATVMSLMADPDPSDTNPFPVELYLNTPGGDVTSMFAIHDAIRTSARPIHVYASGQVVSAGVLLLACGHRRFVSESCALMSHEATVGGEEELGFGAAKDRRGYEDWCHTHWCELMARYTPQEAAWWKRKTERKAEYWLLGGAAIVEAGLADEVWK